MPGSTTPSRPLKSALIAALAICITLVVAATANAGQFVVTYCTNGAAAQGWSTYATGPGSSGVECSANGRMRATLAGTTTWGQGSTALIHFDAPDGLTIAAWDPTIRYQATKHADDTERLRLNVGPVPTASPPISCINTQCPPALDDPVPVFAGARSVEARTTCVNELEQYSSCKFEAELLDFGGTLTLDDPHPPTLRGSVSGPIVNASSPATAIHGTSTVTAASDDVGSGVWKTEVRGDGAVLGQSVNGCTPQPTSSVVPCRLSQDATIDVDSSKLGDGEHQVSVVTTDASGNETTLWKGQVFVVNSPIGPGSALDLRGAPTGSDATDNARVTASWPVTATHVPKSCDRRSYRRRHRARCTARPAKSIYRGAFTPSRPVTVTGRVTNTGTGDAITNAPVQLVGNVVRGSSSAWSVTVRTDQTGRWRAAVPRNIGARQITVSYKSRENDTRDTARTTALLLVRTRATLHAKPRRTRPGRVVRFTGRLQDGYPGVPVALQAYSRGRFRTFATVASGPDGRFTVRYRMGRDFRGTYRFRADVQPTSTTAYPYIGAASNEARVRVTR